MKTRLVKQVKNSKFIKRFPGFNPGSLVVVLLCSFLIVMATFTPIPILKLTLPSDAFVNPSVFFQKVNSINTITNTFSYIPQIPVLIMIASILGPRLGLLSVLIYIAVGLQGTPVFAAGGGLNYYMQYGFGYIIGFIPGVLVTGNILAGKQEAFSRFRAALAGMIVVHITGILYLVTVLFIKRESVFSVFGWVWQSSGIQFFYDLIFAMIAVVLGRFLRKILWIAMD